ncbi:MAG TPA: hypothetical protein VN455_04310, partial [Methanotrichaceae archaeon]|nr:hypothetical protein [Methanotrichaceae archaeon]
AAAEYTYGNNITFNLDQSIHGDGFFRTYKYATMSNALGLSSPRFNSVEAKDSSHGSGQLQSEYSMAAKSTDRRDGVVPMEYGVDLEPFIDTEEAFNQITMKEASNMVYRPMSMGLGAGYYSAHPVTFNSLVNDKTWIKNHGFLQEMYQSAEYAHSLNKEMDVDVEDYETYEADPGTTKMNLTEDMIDGRAHIKVYQGNFSAIPDEVNESTFAESESFNTPFYRNRNPDIEIQEDYAGSYHLTKNMVLFGDAEETTDDEDWIPCCGYKFLDSLKDYPDSWGLDQKKIFDCTCFSVPSKAQF